jgi:hypothetical protein
MHQPSCDERRCGRRNGSRLVAQAATLFAAAIGLVSTCPAADFLIEDDDLQPVPADVVPVIQKVVGRDPECGVKAGNLRGRPVDLDGDGRALDWIVTTTNTCLWGAAVGPIWVVRRQDGSSTLVLANGGYQATVGQAKRNGLRQISIEAASAGWERAAMFDFDGSKYVATSDETTSAKADDPAPVRDGGQDETPATFQLVLLGDGRALGGVADRGWIALDKLPKTYKGKPVKTDCDDKKRWVDMGGIKGGETYRLFSQQGAVGTGTGGHLTYRCSATASVFFEVAIKPSSKEGQGWRYAIGGDWDVLPRVARREKANKWLIDVDGDGKDEVVRVAAKAGKNEEGAPVKVVTHTLEMNGKKLRLDRTTIGGDYGSQRVDMEVADLNGDGIMDFLFTTSGFDSSVDVVDVSGGEAKVVAGFHDNGD